MTKLSEVGYNYISKGDDMRVIRTTKGKILPVYYKTDKILAVCYKTGKIQELRFL